jgi:small subunit ribosomal protein S17
MSAETPNTDTQSLATPAAGRRARQLSGRVVSDKMDKTVTVLIERRVTHELYGKIVTRSKNYHAHDETNQCKEGDLVTIEECRPLSRTKSWRVVEVVERAKGI